MTLPKEQETSLTKIEKEVGLFILHKQQEDQTIERLLALIRETKSHYLEDLIRENRSL